MLRSGVAEVGADASQEQLYRENVDLQAEIERLSSQLMGNADLARPSLVLKPQYETELASLPPALHAEVNFLPRSPQHGYASGARDPYASPDGVQRQRGAPRSPLSPSVGDAYAASQRSMDRDLKRMMELLAGAQTNSAPHYTGGSAMHPPAGASENRDIARAMAFASATRNCTPMERDAISRVVKFARVQVDGAVLTDRQLRCSVQAVLAVTAENTVVPQLDTLFALSSIALRVASEPVSPRQTLPAARSPAQPFTRARTPSELGARASPGEQHSTAVAFPAHQRYSSAAERAATSSTAAPATSAPTSAEVAPLWDAMIQMQSDLARALAMMQAKTASAAAPAASAAPAPAPERAAPSQSGVTLRQSRSGSIAVNFASSTPGASGVRKATPGPGRFPAGEETLVSRPDLRLLHKEASATKIHYERAARLEDLRREEASLAQKSTALIGVLEWKADLDIARLREVQNALVETNMKLEGVRREIAQLSPELTERHLAEMQSKLAIGNIAVAQHSAARSEAAVIARAQQSPSQDPTPAPASVELLQQQLAQMQHQMVQMQQEQRATQLSRAANPAQSYATRARAAEPVASTAFAGAGGGRGVQVRQSRSGSISVGIPSAAMMRPYAAEPSTPEPGTAYRGGGSSPYAPGAAAGGGSPYAARASAKPQWLPSGPGQTSFAI